MKLSSGGESPKINHRIAGYVDDSPALRCHHRSNSRTKIVHHFDEYQRSTMIYKSSLIKICFVLCCFSFLQVYGFTTSVPFHQSFLGQAAEQKLFKEQHSRYILQAKHGKGGDKRRNNKKDNESSKKKDILKQKNDEAKNEKMIEMDKIDDFSDEWSPAFDEIQTTSSSTGSDRKLESSPVFDFLTSSSGLGISNDGVEWLQQMDIRAIPQILDFGRKEYLEYFFLMGDINLVKKNSSFIKRIRSLSVYWDTYKKFDELDDDFSIDSFNRDTWLETHKASHQAMDVGFNIALDQLANLNESGALRLIQPNTSPSQLPQRSKSGVKVPSSLLSHQVSNTKIVDPGSKKFPFWATKDNAFVSFQNEVANALGQEKFTKVKARMGVPSVTPADAERLADEAFAVEKKRLADEEMRLAEEARIKQEQISLREKKLVEEKAKLAEEARKVEEIRLAKAKKLEDDRARLAKEEKMALEKKIADEKARIAEEKRLAEQKKIEEEKAKIEEEKRLAKEKKIADDYARLANIAKKAEEKRLNEVARIAEEKEMAEATRMKEENREAEEKRLREEARIAEKEKKEEEAREKVEKKIAEEARLEEEERLAKEKKTTEEKAKVEQERLKADEAHQARLVEEEKKLAEKKKIIEEKFKLAEDAAKQFAEEERLVREKMNREETPNDSSNSPDMMSNDPSSFDKKPKKTYNSVAEFLSDPIGLSLSQTGIRWLHDTGIRKMAQILEFGRKEYLEYFILMGDSDFVKANAKFIKSIRSLAIYWDMYKGYDKTDNDFTTAFFNRNTFEDTYEVSHQAMDVGFQMALEQFESMEKSGALRLIKPNNVNKPPYDDKRSKKMPNDTMAARVNNDKDVFPTSPNGVSKQKLNGEKNSTDTFPSYPNGLSTNEPNGLSSGKDTFPITPNGISNTDTNKPPNSQSLGKASMEPKSDGGKFPYWASRTNEGNNLPPPQYNEPGPGLDDEEEQGDIVSSMKGNPIDPSLDAYERALRDAAISRFQSSKGMQRNMSLQPPTSEPKMVPLPPKKRRPFFPTRSTPSTKTISRDLNHVLQVAEFAARRAGEVMLATSGKISSVETKSNSADLVTQSDIQCQSVIKSVIDQYFPNDDFLGEEDVGAGSEASVSALEGVLERSGENNPKDERLLWVVDPIGE